MYVKTKFQICMVGHMIMQASAKLDPTFTIMLTLLNVTIFFFFFRELTKLLQLQEGAKAAKKGKWNKEKESKVHSCLKKIYYKLRIIHVRTCTYTCMTLGNNYRQD